MASTVQHPDHDLSGINPRTVSAALALAVVVGTAILSAHAQAYTESVLYSFKGGTDGSQPVAGLVLDSRGNLYGTTMSGGAFKFGTVFEVSSDGKEIILHSFAGPDGAIPYYGSLVSDSAGNLYGTTWSGGASGGGTVFEVDTKRNENVLYSFNEGALPLGGLVRDSKGRFYGTSSGGGTSAGTVFELAPKSGGGWTETVLYSFGGGKDGANPIGGLVRDPKGNFYGATDLGGFAKYGTVFQLNARKEESILHTFRRESGDGRYPVATLLLDAGGNLYGTTENGGVSNWGTVFKVDASGRETVLHSFTGGTDGRYPTASLITDAEGNLYGTTSEGGTGCAEHGCGIVFRLDPTNSETVLYRFTGKDGRYPFAGLVLDAAGNLYGTTSQGGSGSKKRCFTHGPEGCGTVFKLTLNDDGKTR